MSRNSTLAGDSVKECVRAADIDERSGKGDHSGFGIIADIRICGLPEIFFLINYLFNQSCCIIADAITGHINRQCNKPNRLITG
jgi:hypothetical protein